jgi:hypothetical protein
MGEGVPTNPKKGFTLELKAARDSKRTQERSSLSTGPSLREQIFLPVRLLL